MNDARIWDRLAGRYDTIVRLFDTSYSKVRERLKQDLPFGGRVLEIAAGTGQFTIELARLAGALVATDVSPKMVDRLCQRVTKADLSNVDCAVMSAYELDATDSSFDGIFCANALHVMNEPMRALAEFRRVLRKDGVLVVPTFLHGVDGLRRRLSQSLGLVSPFVAHTRFDLATLKRVVEEAGFEVVHAEQMPGLFPLGYIVAKTFSPPERTGPCAA